MEIKYNIRMVMPEDKQQIEKLFRLDIDEKGEIFEEKRFEWGILRRIYDPLQRHGIFVAEQTESESLPKILLGFIFAEMKLDPFGSSECYIKRIYVGKEFRGKLIGQGLLSNLIEHLKSIEVKIIRYDLHLDSINTKALLKQFNFKPKYTIFELKLNE